MIIAPYRYAGGGGSSTLLNDLVSWWALEEASGIRFDAHGSNDLTDNNTVTQLGGKINNAAQFTQANSEYLSRGAGHGLHGGDRDFTIAGWVYLDNISTRMFASVGSSSGLATALDWLLHYRAANNAFRWQCCSGGGYYTVLDTSTGVPNINTWYHLLAQYDATANELALSVNNNTFDTLGSVPGLNNTGNIFGLGFPAGASSYHNGRLDEMCFWSKLLTTDERIELYNSGSGIAYPG